MLVAMMLATFMSAIEATIVATAMPTIVADLGGFRLFSWVFSAFMLTQAVSVPVYGKLADMYGRKRVLYAGTGLFLAASLLCGLAESMAQLIAYRALQGIGAGAVLPIALTIVGDIYTPTERARIQGYLASVWGFSSIVGPMLGALFVETLHWALVFWINLPVGLLSLAMVALFFEERVPRRAHRIDASGVALMTVGLTALMLALVQGTALSAAGIAGLLALALAALAGFWYRERRAAEPLLPPVLWRHPILATGNVATFAAGALLMGVVSFLPTYVQGVMGRSPAVAGFALAMMSIGWPLASTLGGRVMVYTSYRAVAVAGAVGLVAGTGVLMGLHPTAGPLWAGAGTFLVGVGMGLSMTTYLVAIQASVDWNRRGVATSANMCMRIVGQAMGAALCGAVLNYGLSLRAPGQGDVVNRLMERAGREALPPDVLASLTDALGGALHQVYLMCGVLALLAAAMPLWLPRRVGPADARADS